MKRKRRFEGPDDCPDNEVNRGRLKVGLPALTNRQFDPEWKDGEERPVWYHATGEGVSLTWMESGAGKIVMRATLHQSDELRTIYEERTERLSRLLGEHVNDERECGLILLDLTNIRGKGQSLRADSMDFIRGHFAELIKGAGPSTRQVQRFLEGHWGIKISISIVNELLSSPRRRGKA